MKELKEAEDYSEEQIRKHSGGSYAEFPTNPAYALVNFIIWGIVYGYFALRYDDDPEVCYAANGKYVRISESKLAGSTITNVGDRFRICFQIFFFVCLLQLVMVTFMQIVSGKEGLRRGLSLLTIFA